MTRASRQHGAGRTGGNLSGFLPNANICIRHRRLPPLGRPGQVSDVVDGVLFLESSPYITGEILHVDGGQTAGHAGPYG